MSSLCCPKKSCSKWETCQPRKSRDRLWRWGQIRDSPKFIHENVLQWLSLLWKAIFRLQSMFDTLSGVAWVAFYARSLLHLHWKMLWKEMKIIDGGAWAKNKITGKAQRCCFEVHIGLISLLIFWHSSFLSISSTLVFIFVTILIRIASIEHGRQIQFVRKWLILISSSENVNQMRKTTLEQHRSSALFPWNVATDREDHQAIWECRRDKEMEGWDKKSFRENWKEWKEGNKSIFSRRH